MAYEHILEFRSTLDIFKETWVSTLGYGFGGISAKPGDNYHIELLSKKEINFTDDSGEINIRPTPYSVPFEIQIDKSYFSRTDSDDSLALTLHKFIAHFIDCCEHILLEINAFDFKLDGRPILFKEQTAEQWRRLNYSKQVVDISEIFEEYSLLGESGGYDIVCMEAAYLESLDLSWQFLVDAVASFDSGHFEGCMIYACTAVELEVEPIVRQHLIQSTLTGADDYIDRTLIEIGNPMRFEIFFKSEETNALSLLSGEQRLELLKALKWLNNLRNRVVHSGMRVSHQEAKKATRVAGLLLRCSWVHKRRAEHAAHGFSDVFSDSEAKIRSIKIEDL